MDKSIVDSLSAIAEKSLLDSTLFLVDINIFNKGNLKIVIIVDGDKGVTINKYKIINQRIASEIKFRNLITYPYTLEVSSPGLDRPLKLKRQYHANIKRKVQITLKNKIIKEGVLLEVEKTHILIQEKIKIRRKIEYKESNIFFEDIAKTIVIPSLKREDNL